MKTIRLAILPVILLVVSCSTIKVADSYISIKNTKWLYVDEDKSYSIIFSKNGHLISTNTNDVTPDNDYWEQERSTVRFNFNNSYSNYEGHFTCRDTIKGVGQNSEYSWSFVMSREE